MKTTYWTQLEKTLLSPSFLCVYTGQSCEKMLFKCEVFHCNNQTIIFQSCSFKLHNHITAFASRKNYFIYIYSLFLSLQKVISRNTNLARLRAQTVSAPVKTKEAPTSKKTDRKGNIIITGASFVLRHDSQISWKDWGMT